jgi:hypothetical protein
MKTGVSDLCIRFNVGELPLCGLGFAGGCHRYIGRLGFYEILLGICGDICAFFVMLGSGRVSIGTLFAPNHMTYTFHPSTIISTQDSLTTTHHTMILTFPVGHPLATDKSTRTREDPYNIRSPKK